MPLGTKPQCFKCRSLSSTMWGKNEKNDIVCSLCISKPDSPSTDQNNYSFSNNNNINNPSSPVNSSITSHDANVNVVENNFEDKLNMEAFDEGKKNEVLNLRKSTRSKTQKAKLSVQNKSVAPKGKSRRAIFKKNVSKSAGFMATPTTTTNLFYKGQYYQVGDIVALEDIDDHGTYYAQIRGLVQDQYCEKSAVLTWLIPTTSSPMDHFDPTTYVIGPEEDIPRQLDCMEFISHAPSDYFRTLGSPYPTTGPPDTTPGFHWTRITDPSSV